MADAANLTLGRVGWARSRGKFGLGGGRLIEGDVGGVRGGRVRGGISRGSPVLGMGRTPRSCDGGRGGVDSFLLRRDIRAVSGNRGGDPSGRATRRRSSRGSGGRLGAPARAALGRSQSGTGRLVCSSTNCPRPFLHTTVPVPSRRTNAGMVVMPYKAMRASPTGPAASKWGRAVHGIVEKRCSVSRGDLHRDTRITSKGSTPRLAPPRARRCL